MIRGRGFETVGGKLTACLVAAGFLVTGAFAQTERQSHRHEHAEFCEAALPPMPNAFREVTPDDVKRFWVGGLPAVHPPSRSSPGYAYDMAAYRERLEARNALVEKIHRGILDEKAAAEALRHNIRHHRNRGNDDKAAELEFELLRREAVNRGDLGAVVKLEELRQRDAEQMEAILRQQSRTIQQLRQEVERLRREVGKH